MNAFLIFENKFIEVIFHADRDMEIICRFDRKPFEIMNSTSLLKMIHVYDNLILCGLLYMNVHKMLISKES